MENLIRNGELEDCPAAGPWTLDRQKMEAASSQGVTAERLFPPCSCRTCRMAPGRIAPSRAEKPPALALQLTRP